MTFEEAIIAKNVKPDDSSADLKMIQHEEAAHQKRNWVRLTSMCNQKCTFCLDTLAHNETMAPEDEIKTRIIEGRRKGATRLILSGGEPTIHPLFVKFVKLGRMAGYERVQTVTNGRMFSYPKFLKQCLDAGLQEITFSVHGHNAKVHDALVGVPGAFKEEVEGIRAALRDGRPIINLDVCLNRGNIKKLPELLDNFIDIGIREFDLLHLIPFGNAWNEKHRHTLVYDIEEAMPYVQAALRYSERPDLHIWFNRFPPPYLEGYEELIQDPYKLNDEARGRYEEYELWLTRRMPLSCRQQERCDRCYMQHFCDTLEETMDRVADDRFDAYRVNLNDDSTSLIPPPAVYDATWVVGDDLEAVNDFVENVPSPNLILELHSYEGFWERVKDGVFKEKSVARVVVDCEDDLRRFFEDGEPVFEVLVYLNKNTASWLSERLPDGHANLVVSLKNYEMASDSKRMYPDLHEFFDKYKGRRKVENIAPCIWGGEAYEPNPAVLDSNMVRKKDRELKGPTPGDTGGRGSILKILDTVNENLSVGDPAKEKYIKDLERLGELHPPIEKGVLEIFGYSHHYIENRYYAKSLRCKSCVHDSECRGMHINYVRSFGFKGLEPVSAAN